MQPGFNSCQILRPWEDGVSFLSIYVVISGLCVVYAMLDVGGARQRKSSGVLLEKTPQDC